VRLPDESRFSFEVTHREGAARAGVLRTPHGVVETPAFMPVGTRGAVKAVTHRDLMDAGAQIVLANTYHLYLRPGDDLIARLGGLHRFMSWDRPILTDSGGYQVFSLADTRTVGEEAVRFRSHLDGSAHALSPEKAADIQAQLGSDIAMVLDECAAAPASPDVSRKAMMRTARWARRARDRFLAIRHGEVDGVRVTNPGQAQFGIVQGGIYPALRTESVQRTLDVGFEAYAIGGLSVGEPVEVMYEVVAHTAPLLPDDRPRYLMGTGMPDDIFESVARGVDMFDCVLPTRNARNGQLLTRDGRLVIKNARYADDERPPDPACRCYTCRHFSRAYLRHLFLSGEMTAATLNSLHNLHFYLDTLRRIREAIVFGSFEKLRQEFHRTFSRRSIST
jgi:queuine tRNA-ribosyltransferase